MEPPRRKSSAENRFLARAIAEMREAGYRVVFSSAKELPGVRCAGYFEFEIKKLTIAAKDSMWFQAFVHEYAHFKQTLDELWVSPQEMRTWQTFDEWLLRQSNPNWLRILECCRTIQECELDAERRAVALVKQFELESVNVARYITGSNVYVLQYEAARRTRLWPKRWLCRSQRARALFPEKFIRRVDRLPPGYLDLFREFCVELPSARRNAA